MGGGYAGMGSLFTRPLLDYLGNLLRMQHLIFE